MLQFKVEGKNVQYTVNVASDLKYCDITSKALISAVFKQECLQVKQ